MSMGFLAIAGAFFVVTMALAVGPLLLCRLFLEQSCDAKPRPGMFAFLPGVVGLIALVFGLGAVMFLIRSQQPAVFPPGVTESAARTQSSLFDAQVSEGADLAPAVAHAQRPTWWAVLLPILLVTTLLAFIGDRVRAGLFRVFPVAVVACLVIALFVTTSAEHRRQNMESIQHRADVAEQQTVQLARWEHERAEQRQELLPVPVVDVAAVDESPDAESVDAAVSDVETPASESPLVVEYVSRTDAVGVPRDQLPEWTNAKDGGPVRIISSGLHATVELAERNALDELTNLMLAEFVRQHPEARGWRPPGDVILQSGSIQRRAVQRSEITVGEFTSPMYEAYWQVDTTADGSLYRAWRPTQVKFRLAWLGAGVGLLTLLFGTLAALLRVDEQAGGQKRKQLALGTVLLWAILGGALVIVA